MNDEWYVDLLHEWNQGNVEAVAETLSKASRASVVRFTVALDDYDRGSVHDWSKRARSASALAVLIARAEGNSD